MSNSVLEQGESVRLSQANPPQFVCTFVRGRAAILQMRRQLTAFSEHCGQGEVFDDLEYFLMRPKFVNKRPCLILFHTKSTHLLPEDERELNGAVLLYEYQLLGLGLRAFASDFHGDERTVIAPLGSRARIASLACAALMEQGALAVQLSYRDEELNLNPGAVSSQDGKRWRWATTVREIRGPMTIRPTFDETLALLGKHTRRNLRAVRRVAEEGLGYEFVVKPSITKEEFLAFNRISAYPATDEMAAWRYESMKLVSNCLLLGLRAADGRWLSLIGGRCSQSYTTVEWQLNRTDLPNFSLSTLMRSHHIEYEASRGAKGIHFLGGTPHTIQHSLEKEKVFGVVVLRQLLPAALLRPLMYPIRLEHHFLIKTLTDTQLKWQTW